MIHTPIPSKAKASSLQHSSSTPRRSPSGSMSTSKKVQQKESQCRPFFLSMAMNSRSAAATNGRPSSKRRRMLYFLLSSANRSEESNMAHNFCRRTRREFLWEAGAGFTGLALTGLLSQDGFFASEPARQPAAANPLAERQPHFPAKAKSVIFLFMYGGPSQVDTFDYKPNMYRLDGQTVNVHTFGRGGHRNQGRIVGPKWTFRQYGQCGKYISDLFPHVGTCVDDIAFIHSM